MSTTNRKGAATANTSSSAGPPSKKRKMGGSSDKEQKYYAVRAGHKPGVYTSWEICKQQISGFKGAMFKSFTTYEDASAFAAGRNPPSASSDAATKFYGVAVGRQPGVYTDWSMVQECIMGQKGPKFKKFGTRAEAEEFVRSMGVSKVTLYDGDVAEELDDTEPPVKKVKTAPAKSTGAPDLSKGAGRVPVVYTDGSSRGNGKVGAVAGVGVYFGPNDPRNISERLQGKEQTNQRAELTAILRSLEVIDANSPLEIRTDSKYAISCVTEWYMNWQRNGWMSKAGPVKNKDLVVAIRELLSARDALGVPTQFTWVKGHNNDPGNDAADVLAVAGAMKPL